MLSENEIRYAFKQTNMEEPLCERCPGLLRFAREIERVITLPLDHRLGATCTICKEFQPIYMMGIVMSDFDQKLYWKCNKQPCA